LPNCCQSDGGVSGGTWDQSCVNAIPAYCTKPYLCQGQCQTASDCPTGQGCLATYACGNCFADYDCLQNTDGGAGVHCITGSGQECDGTSTTCTCSP
jgi:hypothetical protein